MFRHVLRQYSGMSTQEHVQENKIISKWPLLIFTVFCSEDVLSRGKIFTLHLRELNLCFVRLNKCGLFIFKITNHNYIRS